MRFMVEQKLHGDWRVVDTGIEAGNTTQAVARACKSAGLYRARISGASLGDRDEIFSVAPWGPPVRLPGDAA